MSQSIAERVSASPDPDPNPESRTPNPEPRAPDPEPRNDQSPANCFTSSGVNFRSSRAPI